MIEYVVDTLDQAGVQQIVVVVGYRADLVREQLSRHTKVSFADQTEQLGTGHARDDVPCRISQSTRCCGTDCRR